MNAKKYRPREAAKLLLLLQSIGREIQERSAAVHRLDAMVRALSVSPRVHADEIGSLRADIAGHKRELRHSFRELERLGCQPAEDDPTTFLVSTSGDGESSDYAWKLGASSWSAIVPNG